MSDFIRISYTKIAKIGYFLTELFEKMWTLETRCTYTNQRRTAPADCTALHLLIRQAKTIIRPRRKRPTPTGGVPSLFFRSVCLSAGNECVL